MTATDGETTRGWRARWVGRENERRRTAYDAALQAWRRRDEQLRRCYTEAEEPAAPAGTAAGLPVRLDDDEIVLSVQPAAELVEVTARHTADLPAVELTVVPIEDTGRPPRLPKGVCVVDAGTAVVTDRRLILAGRHGCQDWPYAGLGGLAHHPGEPFTLLHPQGPGRIRGVRVPRDVASDFRLRLTVAYAQAAGVYPALLDGLDDTIVAHWHDRPLVPAPATPADAPVSARLVRPALVTAVAVALALAAVASVFHGSVPDRPVVGMEVDHGRGVTPIDPALPSASTGIGAPVGSTSPGATEPAAPGRSPTAGPAPATAGTSPAPAAPTGGAGPGRPTQPAPTGTAGRPSRSPSASVSPTPTDRCGAPPNPYGYNYCAGNLVYDPAPDVCDYFACTANLWDGKGYLVQCNDDLLSRTGLPGGPCADHGGTRRSLYVA